MNDVELRVEPNAEAAALAVATMLVEARGDVVLTGGSTPGRAYELAAERRSDWTAVELWWGDERCVPPDDERSNYGLAHRTLLGRVEHLGPVHRIRGELGAEEAAAEYDGALQGRSLELLLLGLGSDGHTASLFPSAPALAETEHLAVPADAGLEPFVDRVTMTLPAIAAAQLVVFLATGESKAEPARRAFAAEPDPAIPASLARGRRTLVVLDAAAASLLN
jgi:6-phosphogluconolactonase